MNAIQTDGLRIRNWLTTENGATHSTEGGENKWAATNGDQ